MLSRKKTTQTQQVQAQQTQQKIQREAEENGAALSQLETQREALRKEQKEYQTEQGAAGPSDGGAAGRRYKSSSAGRKAGGRV